MKIQLDISYNIYNIKSLMEVRPHFTLSTFIIYKVFEGECGKVNFHPKCEMIGRGGRFTKECSNLREGE